MAPDPNEDQDDNLATLTAKQQPPSTPTKAAPASVEDEDEDESDSEDEDNDGQNDEPKLKYTRLTPSLGAVYRSGDSTSSFMVAGDKMVRCHCARSSRRLRDDQNFAKPRLDNRNP
jgi:hypothetical protein